jgi:predicted transcriptional regulator
MANVIAAGPPEGKAHLSSQREDMAKTTFRLPKSLLKEVQHFAIEHDKTDTQVFNEALKAWLVEQKKLRKQSKKSGPERSK